MPAETSNAPKRLWGEVDEDGELFNVNTKPAEDRHPYLPADEVEYLRVDAADAYAQDIRDQLGAEAGALVRERDEAIRLLRHQVEDPKGEDPCWTDHHGLCQAHALEQPCSVAEARAFLAKHDRAACSEGDNP